MIQLRLDKTKDYGTIIGDPGDGSKYEQNCIRFSADGKRITPISEEEKNAVVAANKAIEDEKEAEKEKEAAIDAAVKKMQDSVKEDKTEKELPDGFMTWSREALVNFGRNKFSLEFKGNKNQVRNKIKALL
ncbi:MAG: hypothetical protein JRC90_10480 [Deltaproteobacteria bacterium]|nr:hypothetical protein [Deltaproteobacteria bacterium]